MGILDGSRRAADALRHSVRGLEHGGRLLRFGTIHTRLLAAFLLLVLLAALSISAVSVALGTRDARDRVVDQLESVARLKEAEIATWIKGLRANLDVVESGGRVVEHVEVMTRERPGSPSYQEAYQSMWEHFEWAAGRMGFFQEVFLMDTGGRVILSTNRAHENEKHSIYDYFREGMNGVYIQQPSYSLSSSSMSVVASAPVGGPQPLGVLAGRASLGSLDEIMLERTGLGDTGETYLVGSNHRLLTTARLEQYTIPETYVRNVGTNTAIGSHQNGSGRYRSYHGASVIGVYRWIPELQVALLAEQEEGEAFAATRRALVLVGGVASLAVLLAVLVALFLTRSIVAPLAELASTASQIAAGDMERVARAEGRDEVATMANAFNRMTSRLRDLVESLRNAEEKYRSIFENTIEGMYQSTPDGRLLMANSAMARMFGYDSPGEFLSAVTDVERQLFVDPSRRVEEMHRLEEVSELSAFEFQAYRKDGTMIWVSDSARAVRDDTGALVRYEGAIEDITERKEAEEAVRQSEERYRELVEAAIDAIFTLSTHGAITSLNPAFERITGWPCREWLGRPFSELLHPDDLPVAREFFGQVLQGTTSPAHELRVRSRSGEYLTGEFSTTAQIQQGRVIGVLGIARDITERRKAEEAVRKAEERYRSIVENAIEGIYQSSPEGRLLMANPAMARMFGYDSPGDLLEAVTDVERQLFVDPSRRSEELRCLEELGAVTGFEFAAYRRDGSTIWVSDTARAVRGDNGAVLYYEGAIEDISERKEAEGALFQQERELAVLEERGRMARDLHDAVTQTLFSASLIAEVLPRLWDKNPAEGRKRLDELRRLTRGALAEMRMLLLELRPAALKDVSLGELLRQITDAASGRSGMQISLSLEGEARLPEDVKIALYRISQEALNNIQKHAEAREVSVVWRDRKDAAQLTITDDGIGFDPGGISADHMGLNIMRERAAEIGATLTVKSRSGHGTQITIAWTTAAGKE